MKNVIRIATRKSALAMWQARHVRQLLQDAHAGLTVELVPIVTRGDRILDKPLALIGGKGLFLKELERALLAGEADIAVHSMKDVPAEMEPGLELEVVLERASPFDALVSRGHVQLADLPAGARVGTSSLRRKCQLLASRPDLSVVDLRGNVDTRLKKLNEGQYDAIILACAGLDRLGWGNHISQRLLPPDWLPAATQGIIGIQGRVGDQQVRALIEPLGHHESLLQSTSERTVARLLEGSCQVPLAAFASISGDHVHIDGLVGSPDGVRIVRAERSGNTEDAGMLAEAVAADLLAQGAGDIIRQLERL
jgi:hydroxymethylbilane synthase